MKSENKVLNKIKQILNMEVKLETATLEDGVTQIEAEAFEAGKEVFIVMDEERVALAVGDYTLSDGRVLVVETEGIIASIGEAVVDGPVEDPELNNAVPKKIVESQIRETHFEDMKNRKFEEETPEAEVAEVVDVVESVEEEILGEASAIIEELTPDTVTEADAAEMAVAVVDAVKETVDGAPEEMSANFMKKKRKYGKQKMEAEVAKEIAAVEGEMTEAVAEVIDAETPEEVTPEIAEEIAATIVEAVQEIVAEAPEELKSQLLRRTKKEKLSKTRKSTQSRIKLAKEKIAKLDRAKKRPAGKKITHNPSRNKKQEVNFKYQKNAPENSLDRVYKKLFK